MASARIKALLELKTVLEGIDGTGSYHNDIAGNGGVQLWDGGGLTLATLPLLVISWGNETYQDSPVDHVTKFMDVQIGCLIRKESGRADLEVIDELLEDVERAILTTRDASTQTVDITLQSNSLLQEQEDSPAVGANLSLRMHYRHLETDPAQEAL